MNDYGVIVGPGTVRFERLLPGPIERVWSSHPLTADLVRS
jgi:uncharacterized protein YndB with AHSA1/START domain